MPTEVILVFDIGKTNKKYFLFDQEYCQLSSEYISIAEIKDDDGFACDDLAAIEAWMMAVYKKIMLDERYKLVFINFSSYGATLVHLDEAGKSCTPLYNYLKDFPEDTRHLFTQKYGDLVEWSRQTASPFLGMLNAGLQLFWLKYKKPDFFKQIHTTLFLPQYLSYRFTNIAATDFTGIGCHTGIWDFDNDNFHFWMYAEGFVKLLPPVHSSRTSFILPGTSIKAGIGIHDSSAALVPYLKKSTSPFMLLSTGTWSICLNPFNAEPLTDEALADDCLCYLQPDGKQAKASRFFMGFEFRKWIEQLDVYFKKAANYHHAIIFNKTLFEKSQILSSVFISNTIDGDYYFNSQPIGDLGWFDNYEEAYHRLIKELAEKQVQKIKMVMGMQRLDTIYVDGGFANNKVFIGVLEEMLPDFNIITSETPLGTSLGAAMMGTYENCKTETFR